LHTAAKWEAGVGVADGEDAGVDVARQRVHGVEDGLGHAAGLVDDDQHVAGVDALEGRGVVVGGLAAEAEKLLADVPLVLERDPPRQVGETMCPADLSPQDRVHLLVGRRSGDDERFAGRVSGQPPGGDARGCERLAAPVAGLDRRVPVVVDRLSDLALLRPHELAGGRGDPADRIVEERVRVRPHLVGSDRERRRGEAHPLRVSLVRFGALGVLALTKTALWPSLTALVIPRLVPAAHHG
jgi:hypothetical protein